MSEHLKEILVDAIEKEILGLTQAGSDNPDKPDYNDGLIDELRILRNRIWELKDPEVGDYVDLSDE